MAYFDNKKNFLIALKGEPGADGKTPYIQDGYWYIDGVNQGVKAVGEPGTPGSQPYIVLDEDSQGADVTNAITAYQNSANIFWQDDDSELCGLVGVLLNPQALYFMQTSKNRIVKVGVVDGAIAVNYYRITGESIQAVMTAEEMHRIISYATPYDVGSFYMYLGTTTTLNGKTYKQGAVYRIGEE